MIRKTINLNKELVKEIEIFAKKDERDFSSALRYALRIGILSIANPDLTFQEIKDIIDAKIDYEEGRVSKLSLDEF